MILGINVIRIDCGNSLISLNFKSLVTDVNVVLFIYVSLR